MIEGTFFRLEDFCIEEMKEVQQVPLKREKH